MCCNAGWNWRGASLVRGRWIVALGVLLGTALVVLSGAGPSGRGMSATVAAADWPQFLGPNGDGHSKETGLLDTWPAAGPKVVWRAPGGVGMSGIAVRGDLLATMVQTDGKQWLVAHDVATGKQKWRTELAPEYRNSMGNGPRGTPAIADDLVFAFTGEGILAACRVADGKLVWSHAVVKELGGQIADYGMASSPILSGDHVLVLVGAPQATVAAYARATGKLAWKGGADPAGYSSPAVRTIGGVPQVVVASGSSILGLDPRTGASLWRYPYETDFNCNIAVPVVVGGQVFVSSGENHGCALLELKPAAAGQFTVAETWTSFGPKSVMRNEWQTSVLLDGKLYGMDNVGGAGPVTHLTCVDAATGERLWQKPRFGKGNFIAADGKLFVVTMQGELAVVRATPKAFEEIGRGPVLGGTTRQGPSLANGRLYFRDDSEIVCVDVRSAGGK